MYDPNLIILGIFYILLKSTKGGGGGGGGVGKACNFNSYIKWLREESSDLKLPNSGLRNPVLGLRILISTIKSFYFWLLWKLKKFFNISSLVKRSRMQILGYYLIAVFCFKLLNLPKNSLYKMYKEIVIWSILVIFLFIIESYLLLKVQ